jgi:hypothetical protein
MTRPPATAAAVIIVAAAVAMGIEFSLNLPRSAGVSPAGRQRSQELVQGFNARFFFSGKSHPDPLPSDERGNSKARRPKVLAISELPTD